MGKLILLSVVIATIAIPARAARDRSPKRGLKKAIVYMCLFNVFYLFSLIFLYGRI